MHLLDRRQVDVERACNSECGEGIHETERLRGGPCPPPRSPGSHAERGTAAAAALLVRVRELEALAHQRLLPFEGRSVQVHEALRVDDDTHRGPVAGDVIEDSIARVRMTVVKLDDVSEARAAASADAEAKAV